MLAVSFSGWFCDAEGDQRGYAMRSEEFVFAGHSGDSLSARLTYPPGIVRATAIFAHCFTCSKDIPAAKRITSALAHRGFAVLSFDFTGLGHSEGQFANTNFTSNVADIVFAGRALEAKLGAPSLLVGHSLGGAAVLRATPEMASVTAVATIGAPSDPSHLKHLFGGQLGDIEALGEAEVDLGGRPFTIKADFLRDIDEASIKASLANLDAAVLILHSPVDEVVDVSHAAEIFRYARHPKSYVSLDDADHLIRKVKDATYVAEVIASWASRYVPDVPDADATAPDGAVVVSEVNPDGFAQDVLVGGVHALAADEPLEMGGTNTGPTPYHFVSIALGACTSMTIRLYARRKKIPLDYVSVRVTHAKRHAIECEGCESQGTAEDHFERTLTLEGTFTEEQRASMVAIADKCPVHRTLEASAHISTTLVAT